MIESIDSEVPEVEAPVPPPQPAIDTAAVVLRNNPVLRREMSDRLRGARGVLLLIIPLAIFTGVLVLTYTASSSFNQALSIDVTELGTVGRQVFEWVLSTMLALLLFMVPGLTAGAVTGERERQTLVPLQMTLMSPVNIIVGKLAAALAFLVLLIFATIPLLAASHTVGGIGVLDIVRSIAMLIFTATVLGAVCIWISSRMKRTATATVVCYGVTFFFTFGGFIVLIIWAIVFAIGGSNDIPPPELLSTSPFNALGDSLPRTVGQFDNDVISPLGGARELVRGLAQERAGEFGGDFDDGVHIWLYYTIIGTILLVLSVRGAAKAITTPAETER